MMGKSHLMLGAAGWLAIGAPIVEATGHSLSVTEIATGTVVAAGAAMLPDLDHPHATVSHSLGPVTHVISKVFAKCLGGHRNGSHSLLFALAVTLGLAWGLHHFQGPWLAFGVCFFFSSLVLRTLTEADGIICAALSAIIGATLITLAPEQEWLFMAVGLGCLLHDLGDVLTPEGVPPLWPLTHARLSVPIIGHTGDWREHGIAALCGLAACYLLLVSVYQPLWNHSDAPVKPKPAVTKTVGHAAAKATQEVQKHAPKIKHHKGNHLF